MKNTKTRYKIENAKFGIALVTIALIKEDIRIIKNKKTLGISNLSIFFMVFLSWISNPNIRLIVGNISPGIKKEDINDNSELLLLDK